MTAIQDQVPHHHCYGCGVENDKGLQIKSTWDGDECVCHYTPSPEQCAGPLQYVYGGTIASIIDCHCVNTAMANYYKLEGRQLGESPEIWCVTGKLTVGYLAPTPIDQEIVLRAKVEECAEKKTVVSCRAYSGDIQTAEAEVIAVRVSDSWKNASDSR